MVKKESKKPVDKEDDFGYGIGINVGVMIGVLIIYSIIILNFSTAASTVILNIFLIIVALAEFLMIAYFFKKRKYISLGLIAFMLIILLLAGIIYGTCSSIIG